jgi:hypothetical protein
LTKKQASFFSNRPKLGHGSRPKAWARRTASKILVIKISNATLAFSALNSQSLPRTPDRATGATARQHRAKPSFFDY